MGNLGFGELILIIFFALLVFGPKKLPELGKAAGTTLREFKKATKGILDDDDVETKSKISNE
ncbi:twin-arginine translocase TatA/TatE family subunit [Fredinandcohnia onubensis]|uniref:twin-arginine translocase TatA/TatE family subunit n=2 Tax=Fredinandcohnia onubensis TaxID=1571209 RepID=UPI0015D4910D|nr:twin-arginine translocase TatA/TatE family subunit [Fredinandcohnia onubensis]MCS0543522.1 twin-arginine translocase TatA/TatE family subunit [Aeromonas veronii]